MFQHKLGSLLGLEGHNSAQFNVSAPTHMIRLRWGFIVNSFIVKGSQVCYRRKLPSALSRRGGVLGVKFQFKWKVKMIYNLF